MNQFDELFNWKPLFLFFSFLIYIFVVILKSNKNKFNFVSIFLNLFLTYYLLKPYFEYYLESINIILELLSLLLIFIYLLKVLLLYGFQGLKLNLYLLLFLISILLNGFSNFFITETITLNFFRGLINFLWILMVFTALNRMATNNEDKRRYYLSDYYVLFIIAFFGIYDHFILGLNRIGELVNPNYVVLSLLYLFPLRIINSKQQIFNLSNIIFFSLSIYLVFLTESSSGFIGLILFALIYFFFFIIKRPPLLMITLILFLLIPFAVTMAITITQNIDNPILGLFIKSYDLSRLYIFQVSFETFLKNIFFGGEFYNSLRITWLGRPGYVTHNDFIRILAELGIFGLLSFFGFYLSQFHYLNKLANIDKFVFISYLGINLSFILAHNNIQNVMFWLTSSPLFLFHLGKKI